MLCCCKDSELPELFVKVFHEGLNTGFDDAEIVIFHLLSLGRKCAKQSSSGVDKILSLVVHLLVDKEVFLLGSDGGADRCDIVLAEDLHDAHSLLVDGFHRAQQRCLLIERLAVI